VGVMKEQLSKMPVSRLLALKTKSPPDGELSVNFPTAD
jgi:hypothetical protein